MSNWIYLVSTANMQLKRRKPFRIKSTIVFRRGVKKVTIKNEKKDNDTGNVIKGCTFVHIKYAKHIYFLLDTCVYDKKSIKWWQNYKLKCTSRTITNVIFERNCRFIYNYHILVNIFFKVHSAFATIRISLLLNCNCNITFILKVCNCCELLFVQSKVNEI